MTFYIQQMFFLFENDFPVSTEWMLCVIDIYLIVADLKLFKSNNRAVRLQCVRSLAHAACVCVCVCVWPRSGRSLRLAPLSRHQNCLGLKPLLGFCPSRPPESLTEGLKLQKCIESEWTWRANKAQEPWGPPAAHKALCCLRASGGLDEAVHAWGCLRNGRDGGWWWWWWGGSLCIRL